MSLLSQLFGQETQQTRLNTSLELVTYAASLASNPREIDPVLDQVRVITAELRADQAPSPQEEATLIKVYLWLENYLAAKEPVRSFSKEELRKKCTPEMRSRLEIFENKTKNPNANTTSQESVIQ